MATTTTRHWLGFALGSLGVLALDWSSKAIVLERFQLGESIAVIPDFFNLTYVRNTGAAFGMLANAPEAFRVPFFLIVPCVALASIVYLFRSLASQGAWIRGALTLVFGGALGNLIDRVRFGYVVDFFDFHWRFRAHFPAFNVADSAICVGVGILMVLLTRMPDTADGGTGNASSTT